MKLYKIGFWFLLTLFAITLNYLHIANGSYDKEIKNSRNLYEKRISSLLLSNSLIKRKLNDFKGENIITGEIKQNILQNNSLVIFLDKFNCGKCQENEIKRLDSLKLFFESKDLSLFGITSKLQKDVVIRQSKLFKITYPIYWLEDSVFYNLNIVQKFPQIVMVSDNIILSAFFPAVKDDEFSKLYYYDLIYRMNQQ